VDVYGTNVAPGSPVPSTWFRLPWDYIEELLDTPGLLTEETHEVLLGYIENQKRLIRAGKKGLGVFAPKERQEVAARFDSALEDITSLERDIQQAWIKTHPAKHKREEKYG